MALASLETSDFGSGIYRGRRTPDNAVYDALNALLNGERQLFRRGGSAYHSASDTTNNLLGVAAVSLVAGDRVLAWDSAKTYVLDGSSAPTNLQSGGSNFATFPMARIPVSQGFAVIPGAPPFGSLMLYAGSLKNLNGSFTIAVTNGSRDVTGGGVPAWVSTIDRGMFVRVAGDGAAIVDEVVNNNALKLRDPWPGATNAAASADFFSTLPVSGSIAALPSQGTWNGVVWTIAGRIIIAIGNRLYFTSRSPLVGYAAGTMFPLNDYHELSTGSQIGGLDSYEDTLVPFSTTGTWAIQNMSFDAVDGFGNIQQSVGQINDVVLWGNPGVARWNNTIIAPGIADVFLLDPSGATQPITGGRGNPYDDGIRVLYRSYVAAGYQPGTASVHRSHYVLPVVNPSTNAVVDVLVCRLDAGFAWTRWAGHAAGIACTRNVGATVRTPKLLGINLKRVTDLSGCFTPDATNATDADGTTSDFVLITRDYPTGQQPGLVKKIRARYELTDDGSGGTAAPTVAAAYSSDLDGGTFTTLTEFGEQGGGTGGITSVGAKFMWWLVAKRRERIRFRFTQTGAAGSFVFRALEVLVRPQGRQ